MQRLKTKPNGGQVTLAEYVRSWRILKTLDPDLVVPNWNWHGNSAGDVLRDIQAGVDNRVNRHDRTRPATWRKLDPDYQRELRQTAHRLNTPRLVIDWLPADLKSRFSYRLREVLEA